MIRDVLSGADTGVLAQIGLIAFVIAFAAILVYAFTLRKETRTAAKNLPLTEPDEIVPETN